MKRVWTLYSRERGVYQSSKPGQFAAVTTQKIAEAVANKKVPRFFYVYRNPTDSFVNGMIKRMLENPAEAGRLVPSKVMADNHIGSWEVIKTLEQKGHEIVFVDNSLGRGAQQIVSLQELGKKVQYPDIAKQAAIFNRLASKLLKIGRITPEQYAKIIE